jgi:lysophospholipase L1-like esterase
MTFGYGIPIRNRWVNIVADSLKISKVNLGVTGDTTSGMLVRLHTEVFPQKPDAVFVMGGVNDILSGGNSSVAQSNMMAITQEIIARGMVPIVGIIPPTIPDEVIPDWKELFDMQKAEIKVDEYCQWLRRFCNTFKIPTVDFRASFLKIMKEEGRKITYLDGLHVGVEGQKIIAEIFIRETESIVSRY